MTNKEMFEIRDAILSELHHRRFIEGLSNGLDYIDAVEAADDWELYKDARRMFDKVLPNKNIEFRVIGSKDSI
jgi:hypothetical protein